MKLKKLNMNDIVLVKLTDHGKDIYYHRFDWLRERYPKLKMSYEYPNVDANGFTKFQLWNFMSIYGHYLSLGQPNVVEDISFYINPDILDDVEVPDKEKEITNGSMGNRDE